MWDALQDPAVAATLVREAPDIIVTVDHDGRFLQANPAALRHSGYTLEELRAVPLTAVFSPADLVQLRAARDRTAEGEQISATVRYRRKDGQLRWLSARTAAIPHGDGTAMLVFARDVSDEIIRVQALRESDQRFRSLVSAFDRAFFVVDPDFRVAGLFGRWIRNAGLEPRTWLGRTPEEVSPETGGEPHMSALRQALNGQDVTYEWEVTLPGRPEPHHLRVNLSPMRDAEGRVTGIAGVAADVTRRIHAAREAAALRARVAEAERAETLANLVSGVAHELNNPLAAMLNFTEDLLQTEEDDDRRGALEVIRAQALRSRVIVRDLLTFARKGSHRPLAPQSPGPLLDAVARALRPAIGRGVELTVDVRDGDVSLELDRTGFEQVVTNLITNAAHAAARNGRVALEAWRDGETYVITVTDDGPGIPDDVLPHIFEPFFTTKPTGEGTGLGLPVSLGIVREFGGTLEAANRDRGACFTIRLPVSRQPPIASTPPLGVAAVRRSGATPLRDPVLLIVDDEEPIRRALRRYFTRQGWRVEEAADGSEAIDLLTAPGAARHYTVVLCDLRMPEVDGPTVYEAVQALQPALLPRLVMTTGDVTSEAASRFLSGLATPVLEKPFELADVAALCERLRAEAAR